MCARSLFQDIYEPVDSWDLYRNGLLLHECFVQVKALIRSGIKVSVVLEHIEKKLHGTKEYNIAITKETRPHQNVKKEFIMEEGYLYTVDISFKRNSSWIDGAVTYPCGVIEDGKKSFWEFITRQHLKMIESFHPPITFRNWIDSSGLDLNVVLPDMGGHGIGQELHQEPELFYRNSGDYLLTKESVFTHEPVFHTRYQNSPLIAYHESSLFFHENRLCHFPDIKKIFFFDQPC